MEYIVAGNPTCQIWRESRRKISKDPKISGHFHVEFLHHPSHKTTPPRADADFHTNLAHHPFLHFIAPSSVDRDDELLTMERHTNKWSLLALTALVAVSSSADAASSHSSWRLPSLLNRPLRKLSSSEKVHHPYRHRRHDDVAASTISSSVLDIDNVAALSSPIKNAVFCVRGGGEINGPCIGIDLGKS